MRRSASPFRIPNSEFRIQRSAFTLIEMLVAVGLIALMMVLFASIFQLATGTMATQKGISENDQRTRLLVTMLRNDLGSTDMDPVTGTRIRARRTFRLLIPYAAGEVLAPINPVTKVTATPADRTGYFYIYEGNINDDTDDILQLTITVPTSSNDRIYGRAAVLLADGTTGAYGPVGTTPPTWTPPPPLGPYPPASPAPAPLVLPPAAGYYFPNQPEFDDLLGTPNQVGSSTTAEVCYFLRYGTLYRRSMLIRVPNVTIPGMDDHTPTNDGGAALSFTPYTNGTRNFWTDYDYSAFFDNTASLPAFHGVGDLTNAGASAVSTLWHPFNRWGFDNTTNYLTGGGGYGLPKEYVGTNFIGRYTHAETSDPTFGYPAMIGAAGNPMGYANAALTFANGSVTNFPNGTRAGEDVVMSNVLAFDIKVWDPAASLGPDGAPGISGYNDDGDPANNVDDNAEIGAYGSDDGDWRDIGHAGLVRGGNTYGFYRAQPAATNPNIYYSNPNGTPPTNRFDTWGPAVEIDGTVGPGNLDNPPFRPVYFGPDGKPGVANTDDDGNGLIDFLASGAPDPAEIGYPGSDDFAPLTAIKITIRFYDVTSNQIRDISGVYRLIYEP